MSYEEVICMLKFNCSIITGCERRPWNHFMVCENGCEPLVLRILIVCNYEESPQTNWIGADGASEQPLLPALHSRWHWGVVSFIPRCWTRGVENSLDQLLADGVNTNATGPIPEEDSVSKQHYYNVNKLFFFTTSMNQKLTCFSMNKCRLYQCDIYTLFCILKRAIFHNAKMRKCSFYF